jgi:hypothetical protein
MKDQKKWRVKAQRRKENIPWRLGGRQPKRDKNLFPHISRKNSADQKK